MKLLTLGKNYKPYGKLGAVTLINGERYYFFANRRGAVSMIPASAIQPA